MKEVNCFERSQLFCWIIELFCSFSVCNLMRDVPVLCHPVLGCCGHWTNGRSSDRPPAMFAVVLHSQPDSALCATKLGLRRTLETLSNKCRWRCINIFACLCIKRGELWSCLAHLPYRDEALSQSFYFERKDFAGNGSRCGIQVCCSWKTRSV